MLPGWSKRYWLSVARHSRVACVLALSVFALPLHPAHNRGSVWVMKLRFDLVEKLTPEMLLEGVVANTHRYKAEPLLSKTGTGSLSPASTEDRANEEKLSTAIIRKVMKKSGSAGKTSRRKR